MVLISSVRRLLTTADLFGHPLQGSNEQPNGWRTQLVGETTVHCLHGYARLSSQRGLSADQMLEVLVVLVARVFEQHR
jgi:hypothetical protein